ncbi:MAG: hypothetical protein ACE5H0_14145 [Bacteroidota bacterium]
MLSVTHAASAHLAQVLENPEFSPGYVVRIVIEGESAKLTVGEERPDDVCYRYQEKTVLVFDKELANQLEDLTLDIDLRAANPRLEFK